MAGLGAFHGMNPAMGWLFAVALGLHRQSRVLVLLALVPIALGHAVAVGAVLIAVMAFGTVLDARALGRGAGVILIGWALWHGFAGHRKRVRIGMQTGLAGLALWSGLMASAHGAGLMLVPAVLSLCVSPGTGGELLTSNSIRSPLRLSSFTQTPCWPLLGHSASSSTIESDWHSFVAVGLTWMFSGAQPWSLGVWFSLRDSHDGCRALHCLPSPLYAVS